jgi:tetratricopeptide (TPR) repeat protein
MLHRLLWWLCSSAALLAQNPDLAGREQALAQRAAEGLRSVANQLAAQKQYGRALQLWYELWQQYRDTDAEAREKCGFVQVGDLWRKDAERLVLDKDLKGDAKVLKKVDAELVALRKVLQAEHRALATAYEAQQQPEPAGRHWQRVLAMAPGDREASAALALQQFEGYRGTPAELALLRRARGLRGACDWLVRAEFATTPLGEQQHPLLTAAGIQHGGVRSEHFRVFGPLPEAELRTLAADAERALLLARLLFGVATGEVFVPQLRRDMVFVPDPGYGQVLDQCASQFSPERLAFLRNDVDLAFVSHGDSTLRVYRNKHGFEAARDLAVRGVVQDAAGVHTDGLWEGLGHAACGFLFGRTLTFMLEQQRGVTMSTWKPRALAPDLAVWMQIAEESAWAKSDTRTSELVLLSAARFSNEQRVKAWAICHYFALWRPELVLELDRSRDEQTRTSPAVAAAFLQRTQLALDQVDHQWRQFWGNGAALRAAMAADPVPPDAPPATAPSGVAARAVVDAIDVQRAAAQVAPAGFYVAQNEATAAVRAYDEQLAKAAAEQKKKPKEVVPLPSPPAVLGRVVLWSRQAEPAAAVAQWWRSPRQRDAMLHPGRDLLGVAVGPGPFLLDLTLPARPTQRGLPLPWPRHGQTGVAGSAPVGDLGPRAAAALLAQGKAATEVVGMPLSLHFARVVPEAMLADVRCEVFLAGVRQHGVLVRYDQGDDDGDRADGCVAFVPLQPLPAAAAVEVVWTLPAPLLPKDQTFASIVFTVQ